MSLAGSLPHCPTTSCTSCLLRALFWEKAAQSPRLGTCVVTPARMSSEVSWPCMRYRAHGELSVATRDRPHLEALVTPQDYRVFGVAWVSIESAPTALPACEPCPKRPARDCSPARGATGSVIEGPALFTEYGENNGDCQRLCGMGSQHRIVDRRGRTTVQDVHESETGTPSMLWAAYQRLGATPVGELTAGKDDGQDASEHSPCWATEISPRHAPWPSCQHANRSAAGQGSTVVVTAPR
ncbi:hypothetical protein Micbo1qcDRAFT_171502 [Microdochium bolleyi]|uniref:Uncharacterized protein n=1 Tax=Microdochium bolleyi TaxID=196109 RepID=A0A136JD56_9PEZI|nr:hypothetical protein Micbo1qcDRAFT_171502 [Microdochium bolleyi]